MPHPADDAAALVTYEVADRIATITLTRPEKLNAFSDQTIIELRAALNRFDDDDAAWVAIVHGEGRAFSSGADVRQRQLRSKEEAQRLKGNSSKDGDITRTMFGFTNWKPVIAAAHGYVLGVGLHFLLTCDLIVAAAGTKMQVTETTRGLDGGAHWHLLRHAGVAAFANDVALTGRFFTAEEALAAGVITRVAPEGEHLEAARDLASTVLDNPPLAVREVVRIRRMELEELENHHRSVRPRHLHLTEDFRESARAFAEKRKHEPYQAR